MHWLPIELIVGSDPDQGLRAGIPIGESREGRELTAYTFGRGARRVSLIGGCHADEPVGPAMLQRLARFLAGLDDTSPLLTEFRWYIVPHVNPDGARRNAGWSDHCLALQDFQGEPDWGYDPVLYLRHVVRELPGDDVEFGFPRDRGDLEARPENRAVAAFLWPAGPFHLHGSFHGMGFAPGPWFLLEPAWIARTGELRRALRNRISTMGYPLLDVDRRGEKGFRRIDVGFSTRPDSEAMAAHFHQLGDADTATKFRPSSMELVRNLGGDPLTVVSEMPLFLLPQSAAGDEGPVFRPGTDGKRRLHAWLKELAPGQNPEIARREIARRGIRPMPIRDQMRLQLAFLDEALSCTATS